MELLSEAAATGAWQLPQQRLGGARGSGGLEAPRGAGSLAERAQPTCLARGARGGRLLRREQRRVRVAPADRHRRESRRHPLAPVEETHRYSVQRVSRTGVNFELWPFIMLRVES